MRIKFLSLSVFIIVLLYLFSLDVYALDNFKNLIAKLENGISDISNTNHFTYPSEKGWDILYYPESNKLVLSSRECEYEYVDKFLVDISEKNADGIRLIFTNVNEYGVLIYPIKNIDECYSEGAAVIDLSTGEILAEYSDVTKDTFFKLFKREESEWSLFENIQYSIHCNVSNALNYFDINFILSIDCEQPMKATIYVRGYCERDFNEKTEVILSEIYARRMAIGAETQEFLEYYDKVHEAILWLSDGIDEVGCKGEPCYIDDENSQIYYYEVFDERFTELGINSMDSLKSYLHTIFTDELVSELINTDLYRDINGKLYVVAASGASLTVIREPVYRIEVTGRAERILYCEAYNYLYPEGSELIEMEFSFEKINGRWICSTVSNLCRYLI